MIQTWTDRPPGRLEHEQVCLMQAVAEIPSLWADHGWQYLDIYDAVLCLRDRRLQIVNIVNDAPEDYRQHIYTELPAVRLPMYAPELVWIKRQQPCLDFLWRWQKEHDAAPKGFEGVALTIALYHNPMLVWYLPPWRQADFENIRAGELEAWRASV